MSSSLLLEIRLFYVRITPCSTTHSPPALTLTLLRRPINVSLQINGSKVPSSEPAFLSLRGDRLDPSSLEVTYVCTDKIKLSGASDFEICDRGSETLILCGSLEKMESGWSNEVVNGLKEDSKKSAGWSMDVCMGAGINGPGLVKRSCLNPTVEVYVAGCYGGVPLILTQTVQMCARSRKVYGGLDSLPEDEESSERKENVLVCSSTMRPVASVLSNLIEHGTQIEEMKKKLIKYDVELEGIKEKYGVEIQGIKKNNSLNEELMNAKIVAAKKKI